ncbi:MAG TPA: hypothetical protein VJ965_02185 [Anaerolineales bacterium]|nr:hypothetical protein [Anaerolineales bacterium]
MKKITLILLIVVLAALGITGIAMAQDPTPQTPDTPFGGGRYGGGMVGDGTMHEDMIAFYADAFNMTADDLNDRLNDGESMFTIAESLGYTADEFYQMMSEARVYALDQALANGTITQEQYDFMQSRSQGGQGMGGGWGRGSGGRGMGGRHNGQGSGSGLYPGCPNYAPSN